MAYFRKASKNKQIDSIQSNNKYAQTEITFNELDINILKERIKLLEIENDKLRKENATLKKVSKPLNGLKESKALVTTSPLKQNVPIFNSKHKGCTCKGNCANKICGCMKKDFQCSEACKCNARLCKNKELNKENYGTPRQDPSPNEAQKNSEILDYLPVQEKQPLESVSSVDDVFYDASDPDFENLTINLDAVRKLTFKSEEDTPEKENQLSAIQENNEESSQIQKQKENGKVQKGRKGSSSTQINEEQNGHDSKLNKTRKKSASSKDTAANAKKQRKGSKSKRTASVEVEIDEKIPGELIENPKVNSRSRKLRGTSQTEQQNEKKNEKKDEEQIQIQVPEKVDPVAKTKRDVSETQNEKKDDEQIKNQVSEKVKPVAKTKKDVLETQNLKSIRTSGLASSRESISNMKLPKDWRNVRSSLYLEKVGEANEKKNWRNTRSKKIQGNSLKTIVSKAMRAVSNEEIAREAVQSRVRGLRRSISSGAIASEIEANSMQSEKTSKSKVNAIEASRARTLNRSISSDTLSKKPLQKLFSKVSSSFRKSKTVDIEEKPSMKNQLEVSQNLSLTYVKETGNELNDSLLSKEIANKYLKFDPMQPTRQLSRSPLPPVTISSTPEPFARYSPPLYGSYFNQQEIKEGSPPPEILQDLREVEVDLEMFHSKLVVCRKCKRKFFPHRIQKHETFCHYY